MVTPNATFTYRYCGLRIRSNVALPQMQVAAETVELDLTITVSYDHSLTWPEYEATEVRPYVTCLEREHVTLEHAVHGRIDIGPGQIDVAVSDETHWEVARTYVLGTALSVALIQRELCTLHASAVSDGIGVVAFTGETHAGKTTWAGLAMTHFGGYLVSDDVLRVDVAGDEGRQPVAIAWPGLKRLRLREEATGVLRAVVDSVDAQSRLECYQFAAEEDPLPLRALVELVPVNEGDPSLELLMPMDRIGVIWENIFRREYGEMIHGTAKMLTHVIRLATCIKVYRFRYRLGTEFLETNLALLGSLVNAQEQHAEEI